MWRSKIEIDRRWSKIWRSQWGAAKRSDDRGRWNHSGGRLIVCKCNDVQRSYSKAPKARRELRESLRQFYVGVFNTRDIIRPSGQNSLSWTSLSMTGVRGAARLPWGSPRTIQLWRTMTNYDNWIILNHIESALQAVCSHSPDPSASNWVPCLRQMTKSCLFQNWGI